jgi:hypothetical protein
LVANHPCPGGSIVVGTEYASPVAKDGSAGSKHNSLAVYNYILYVIEIMKS